MKALIIVLMLVAGVIGLVAISDAQERDSIDHVLTVPVVIELYTSEGCSSCPAAEELLAELARQETAGVQIIPLAFHVDYWNRLGWNDPYSSEEHSNRQRWYAERFKSSRIYTPQMIVDGRTEFVGSDRAAARQAIEQARALGKPALVLSATESEAGVTLSIGGDSATTTTRMRDLNFIEPATLFVAITEGNLATNVMSGENKGRRLTHLGVVRQLQRLAEYEAGSSLTASEHPIELKKEWKRGNLRAVAFLQDAGGRILAAESVSLAPEKKTVPEIARP